MAGATGKFPSDLRKGDDTSIHWCEKELTSFIEHPAFAMHAYYIRRKLFITCYP